MKDHLMLNVNNLVIPESAEATEVAMNLPSGGVSLPPLSTSQEPLIQTVECRICQEEDNISNLESPCACTGSLKYAHRVCVQRWCDEKGDLTCEICHEYVLNSSFFGVYSGGWTITGAAFDLRDPRIIAMAQNHIMEADYDDYSVTNASSAAFCRSAALILFLLRVAGFLLPFYIMAWAINILQGRRRRQVAAALAATEVAFILQSGQRRGMNFTIAPDSPATPQHERIP
uniref:RING-CH-type domain-containing protein n=1 Tax=Leersia perrieri TaxID=77586 RepID=A0A0D9X877_9ORYZ